MEVAGTVLRQVTYVSGSGTHGHDYRGMVPQVLARSRVRMVRGCGFRDEGHVQYYQDTKNREPVLSNKKKLKLLKDLSKAKGVSSFPQLGFAFDPDQRALLDHLNLNLTTDGLDGGEVLLREIEKVRAEEKEMKKKRKQEKKAKLKALKMKKVPDCESSSSSSSSESESSDSDCDKVVDMNTFRGAGVGVAVTTKQVDELDLKLKFQPPCLQSALLSTPPLLPDTTTPQHVSNVVNNPSAAAQKTIEVCMGNKCKKSGAVALMQEFEKVVGIEGGAVVGCKCMGKCKTAPNVRIQNPVLDHGVSGRIDDSLKKIPSNPLCIGVGLEDVDTIVARLLGEDNEDMVMGVAAATT